MRRRAIVLLLMAVGGTPWVLASGAPRSVWDGIYSDAQASRGEALYRQRCALCHGPTLDGTETAPGLVGATFYTPYYGRSVRDLFTQVRELMPKDAPNTLTTAQTADVLAYMFKSNRYPAGAADLPGASEALAEIRIEPRPQP